MPESARKHPEISATQRGYSSSLSDGSSRRVSSAEGGFFLVEPQAVSCVLITATRRGAMCVGLVSGRRGRRSTFQESESSLRQSRDQALGRQDSAEIRH